MNSKKIIMLLKLPPPYIGPTIASQIILNSDLKKHYDIIHLDTSDHRDISTLGKFDLVNFFIAVKHYFMLIKYIVKYKPSAVYFPNAQTSVAYIRDIPFLLISKIFRKKIIVHLRGGNFKNWYNSLNPVMQGIVKVIHPLADGQIVLGKSLIHMYEGILPEKKIFVVPNGRDFSFRKKENPNPNQKLKILFFANYIRSKGVLDFLHSLKFIKNSERIEYIISGTPRDGDTYDEIKSLVSANENMINLGPTIGEKKKEIFLNADIFCFPTYYSNEGHPWVIVEAMAAGLPIISTDHAAIAESVIDGYNGFLVEKMNPKQIAERIDLLIQDHNLRLQMGNNSRLHYEKNFTEKKFVTNLRNTFESIL